MDFGLWRGCALLVCWALAVHLPSNALAQETPDSAPTQAVQTAVPDSAIVEPTPRISLPLEQSADSTPPLIPTESFAGRSAYKAFYMSPDGSHLAVEIQGSEEAEIHLIDAATRNVLKRYRIAGKLSIDWLEWAGNDKFVMSLSRAGVAFGVRVRFSRIYVRDINTDEIFPLEVSDKLIWGGDLVHVADDGSYALISVQDDLTSSPGVYRYELKRGGQVERIVKPNSNVWEWFADNDGVVRLGMGWNGKRLRVYYREDSGSKFRLVGKLKQSDDASRYWSVFQIIAGSSQGYVIEEGENGRMGVRLFDYSVGAPLETYYENPDWDVDDLWLKPDGTPLAAIYTDDRTQIEWFDEAAETLHKDLKRALKLEEVQIIQRARDNSRLLIWAGSEADPGALYIYTPDTSTLDLLGNYRPALDFRLLVKPKPVKYTARDGTVIPSYLTLPKGREAKNLPLIILPHGGPYGIRDKLQYNDEVQLLANRGYAVLQPNFRGSGGYGEAYFELGTGQIGRAMQDDLDDAMDWAVAEGIADPQRVCVVGASYGGYAALWAVLRNPERYACAASWAGVTDWDSMLKYDRRFFSRKGGRAWRDRVEGEEDFDLDTVSPLEFASQLSRPLLIAHGDADNNVPISQFEAFEEESRKAPVKPVTLRIAGEGHGFSSAENEKAWYDALEAFLMEHNPPDEQTALSEGAN